MADKKPTPPPPYSIVKINGQAPDVILFTTIPAIYDVVGTDQCLCTFCLVDESGVLVTTRRHAVSLSNIIDVKLHHDISPEENAIIMAAVAEFKQAACA